jgi:hypothetical protein
LWRRCAASGWNGRERALPFSQSLRKSSGFLVRRSAVYALRVLRLASSLDSLDPAKKSRSFSLMTASSVLSNVSR